MSPPAAVDVIVLTWNDEHLLFAAVDSILQSEGVDVRVIVVDNGSDPPAQVQEDDRVRLLRSPRNLGVAVGRTVGVMHSTSSIVAFLDSDARLHASTLQRLAEVVSSDENIALAAPVFAGQPATASGGDAPTLGVKIQRALNLRVDYVPPSRAGEGMIRDVDFAIGACQLFRREAWEVVRGLDTTIFYGPEDVDFCLRLKRGGYRVVQVLDATCDHPARRRYKNVFTMRGLKHGLAVVIYLWRHRRSFQTRRD